MTEKTDVINQLHKKMEALLEKQEMYSNEINELRNDINKIKASETKQTVIQKEPRQTADEISGVQSKTYNN